MLALTLLLAVALPPQDWHPTQAPLTTRWTAEVTPDSVLPEYPRPQMRRSRWQSLNGLWRYAIQPAGADRPTDWQGTILVPFAVQSALSGVGHAVEPSQRLWYRRTFTLTDRGAGEHVLLHFGAVDWRADVWLNGTHLGRHDGGYDPFDFDITDALRDGGEQELVVAVQDPTDTGTQPRGKQVLHPQGIWYTAVTGIWQTVWLEPVPESHLVSLRLTPQPDLHHLRVAATLDGVQDGTRLRVVARDDRGEAARGEGSAGSELALTFESPRPWSPDDPHLYDLRLELLAEDGSVLDAVDSYCGLRSITVAPDADGVPRLMLNGRPRFEYGLLDQGWWPDGLYTAPTDAALAFDVETAQRLGFDLLRKHVKVEPARWYWHCDRLGMLVWQDMPSGDRGARWSPAGTFDGSDMQRSPESAAQYRGELTRIVDSLRNHPCIVTWVPFNEGWGQFDTAAVCKQLAEADPTRLVDCASGGNDFPVGDLHDIHRYPGPGSPPVEARRAQVLGEFGGLGLPIAGHTWVAERSWGYRSFDSQDALQESYLELVRRLNLLRADGLSAAVYTQLTDVESEVNGLLTYDRAVCKVDADTVARAQRALHEPPPRVVELVPTSREKPRRWRWTTTAPPSSWTAPDFDDGGWAEGDGGFGTASTPGAVVGTEWKSSDIWLRRAFELDRDSAGAVHLRIHHDEDAEVWIDGRQVAAPTGYTTDYVLVPLAADLTLTAGRHTLAVHCHQTGGGQFIDVGLAAVRTTSAR